MPWLGQAAPVFAASHPRASAPMCRRRASNDRYRVAAISACRQSSARPTPVSITMVTPRSRGRPLRGRSRASIENSQPRRARPIAHHALNDFLKRLLDHREVRSPRHDDHIAVPLDVEFEQAAFEHGEVDCACRRWRADTFRCAAAHRRSNGDGTAGCARSRSASSPRACAGRSSRK